MILVDNMAGISVILYLFYAFVAVVVAICIACFVAFRRSDYYKHQFQDEHPLVKMFVILFGGALAIGVPCLLVYGCSSL
ncbi:hypothetical protein [Fibrella aquatilis]|uniref:Uncharacterized protein n=1 Tax=Fibrella aquatilis TaxID=2817059 RepID=A0A939K2C0_9BACT|nr:hypothetical protein [Fibrella aquatilis]MBO0934403.1 hypothetical protein [Fibrella aquatilis]